LTAGIVSGSAVVVFCVLGLVGIFTDSIHFLGGMFIYVNWRIVLLVLGHTVFAVIKTLDRNRKTA